MHHSKNYAGNNAALYTTALRWVTGWTYFSAFWRRLILENKLIPGEPGYIGEKFNHFLPNALGIKPLIEFLVSNPESLQLSMIAFTIVEAIVGLFLILGLFTRLMSIGVLLLAFGILLGSGWLGTTCLDEWQIGVLGVATGFTLFFTGAGAFSLDHLLAKKGWFSSKKWQIITSGHFTVSYTTQKKMILIGATAILGLTLFTNQYFHGGVFGKLHNKSVKPHIAISDIAVNNNELLFTVFRDEGADVYGSFLIGIQLLDNNEQLIFSRSQQQLSQMNKTDITNRYVAKVKPGKHSLILPLGAKAQLRFLMDTALEKGKTYTLKLEDISGAGWSKNIIVK